MVAAETKEKTRRRVAIGEEEKGERIGLVWNNPLGLFSISQPSSMRGKNLFEKRVWLWSHLGYGGGRRRHQNAVYFGMANIIAMFQKF